MRKELQYLTEIMKTLKAFLVAFIGCIFIQGCVRPAETELMSKQDPGDQQTGVCSLHGLKMENRRVPVVYGLREFAPGLLEVRSREFPNAFDDVGGGCEVGPKTETQVFECPECRRKRDIWMKSNKDSSHITASSVNGRPGFVYSPFTRDVVDVSDCAAGALVRDPTTSRTASEMKIFRVPAPDRQQKQPDKPVEATAISR